MIRHWWRRSVQFRLVSFFLLLSWSSVVTVGTLRRRARQELSAAALTRLEASAGLKGDELRRWIDGQRRDLLVLATWPDLKRAAAAALTSGTAWHPASEPGGARPRPAVSPAMRERTDAVRGRAQREAGSARDLHSHHRRWTHRLLQRRGAHRRIARPGRVLRQGPGRDVRANGVSLAGDGPSAREPRDAARRGRAGPLAGRARGAPESRRDGSHHARAVWPRRRAARSIWWIGTTCSSRPRDSDVLAFRAASTAKGSTRRSAARSAKGKYANYDGVSVFGAWRWFDQLGVAIVAEMPEAAALAPSRRLAWTILTAGFISAGRSRSASADCAAHHVAAARDQLRGARRRGRRSHAACAGGDRRRGRHARVARSTR